MSEEIKDVVLTEAETQEKISEQKQIRMDKLAGLQAAGNDPFAITKFEQSAMAADIKANYEQYENQTVTVAGRMMSRRIMGKASFADLRDGSDRIQLFVSRDDLGDELYNTGFKKWDIGDILGITGYVFTTRTGEISIHVTDAKLLAKSLLPLPEKFHGLTDTDTRYRQRYVDLIMNPDVKETFIKRSNTMRELRAYL
ncbi:MAG: lysine--tRNA ligase, partial [Clostridia bacterium]|nr:lysine--tRNA ligase [Clostridia bacterium]